MGLVESRVQRPSLRDSEVLGLFIGLRLMREDTMTHKDGCSLLSLKEMGTLDISKARVFLYKDLYGKP